MKLPIAAKSVKYGLPVKMAVIMPAKKMCVPRFKNKTY